MSSWPPPRAPRAQISRMPYAPGLDGLRAIAVVSVMVYHASHRWLAGGFLGVEVFFVISGYLITLLLIGEHERRGRIGLRKFWLRRARRLLPPLFVLLGGLAIYMALFNRNPQGQSRGDFLGGLFYGSNWYQIFVGQGYASTEAFVPLRHLWSLAVEEQFYLLWPLVMVLIVRRGRDRLPRVGLWLAGFSAVIAVVTGILFVGGDVDSTCSPGKMHGYWMIAGRCINVNETLYLSTFGRVGGLMLGAAFAMVWRPLAIMRGPLRRKGHLLDLFALLGLASLGLLMWRIHLADAAHNILTGTTFDPWLFRGGFFATGVATLLVIAAVTHGRAWAGKVLGNPIFRWVGTRSYGLYLFHWPIYQIIRRQAGLPLRPVQFAIAIAITVPVTELSYRMVELPVRRGRLGEWLRGERRAQTRAVYKKRRWMVGFAVIAAAFTGFAGISIATADNKCVGDVACSLVIAHEAVEGTTPSSATALRPGAGSTTSTVPASTAPVTTTTSTSPPTTATSTVAGSASSTASTASAPATTGPQPVGGAPPTTAPVTAASTVTVTTTSTGVARLPTTSATPGEVPPATTTTAPPPTTTPPPGTYPPGPPPVAIGESVMAGAVLQLQAGGFFVDALERRQGLEVAAVLEAMRANNQLGQIVVIQTGTNGPVSDATFDRIVATVPAALTPYVYFLTVRADGKGWIADNNTRISALPQRYPHIRIIDWTNLSANTTLCSDGIHVACHGGAPAQFYANMIFAGVGRPDLRR